MTYNTIDNISRTDLVGILQFPTADTPIFYPLIIFAIFVILTLFSFFREVRREGRGNFISSLAVAGFVTTAITVILTMLELVSNAVMVITLVISLIFIVIFLLTRKTGQ